MDRFTYLVDLRKKIAAEISDVQDTRFSLFWNDTHPNSLSRSNVQKLFDHARSGATSLGVHIAVRHGDCRSKSHRDDYVMEPVDAHPLTYGDPRFVWSTALDQGGCLCPCPCSNSGREKLHTVIYDVLYEASADQGFCATLERILADLYEALQRAGEKKPRSGIREYLLRALLTVNDHIRPETLEDYIAQARLQVG